MIVMPPTCAPEFGIAVGLTALLTMSAGGGGCDLPRDGRPADRAAASPWLPCLFLAALAVASIAFALLHPDGYLAAAGVREVGFGPVVMAAAAPP